MKQISYKIILAGDSGVGKTTLVYRYIKGKFRDDFKQTIGVDFYVKNNLKIDGNDIKLQIWDLGGEEKFRSFLRGYIKKSDGVLFLFDLNNINSLNQIGEWMGIMREVNTETPILLVGAKSDLFKRDEKSLEFINTLDKIKLWIKLNSG
jgi:small GTP-binding protein